MSKRDAWPRTDASSRNNLTYIECRNRVYGLPEHSIGIQFSFALKEPPIHKQNEEERIMFETGIWNRESTKLTGFVSSSARSQFWFWGILAFQMSMFQNSGFPGLQKSGFPGSKIGISQLTEASLLCTIFGLAPRAASQLLTGASVCWDDRIYHFPL